MENEEKIADEYVKKDRKNVKKQVEALYSDVLDLNKTECTQHAVRLLGNSDEVIEKRNIIFQKLYRLGEGVRKISEITTWSVMVVFDAVREDINRLKFLSLRLRFCVVCKKEFMPIKVTHIFCCRKCFKKAYYREHLNDNRIGYSTNMKIPHITNTNLENKIKDKSIKIKVKDIRVCLECEREFETFYYRQVFCSHNCCSKNNGKRVNKKQKNGRYKRAVWILNIIKCKGCGKEIKTYDSNRKYCSHRCSTNDKWNINRWKKIDKIKRCRYCNKEINSDIFGQRRFCNSICKSAYWRARAYDKYHNKS